jgi:ribulose-5-phosphate 4-epimerase/fuculose-1-phosphate aldolase
VTCFEMSLSEQMCDIGKNLWNRGMVAANDGHISALISGAIFGTDKR